MAQNGDRRKFIVRSSDELIKNYINIWILSLLFVPVYFMDFDVSTFNPENMTDYQEDLKSLSVSPVEDWLKEILLMIIGHRLE